MALYLLLGLLALKAGAQEPPRIAHIQSERRPDSQWIDVAYDLQTAQNRTVIVAAEASADSGRSYQIPILHTVGALGAVLPGSKHAFIWDAGADAPALFDQAWTVRLIASHTPPLPPAEDMVYIPAGSFAMGSETGDPAEKPVHQVHLSAYWIDRYETTNRAFMRFVQATGYRTTAESLDQSLIYENGGYRTVQGASWRAPSGGDSNLLGRLDHPVVQISWHDAQAYCRWAGKRLPTEAEWEKAARGEDRRLFPWGPSPPDGPSLYKANYGQARCCRESDRDGFLNTAPRGSFAAGRSPYGLYDMAGNVWEWTGDWYGANYYSTSPEKTPLGPNNGSERVLRGGSWISYHFMLRTSYRGKHTEDTRHNYGGFRCARDN